MEVAIKHGFGAYLWLRLTSGGSVFLPIPEEDLAKKERVVGMSGYISLMPGMLGIVSGGIDNGERSEVALRREFLEERRVHVNSPITNGLPCLTVGQIRNDKPVSFDVIGHVMTVEEHLRVQLLQQCPLIEISDLGMEVFLKEQADCLRPFVHSVALQLLTTGQLYRL